jgi:hypothetical protein
LNKNIPVLNHFGLEFSKETISPRTPSGLLVNATMLLDPQQGNNQIKNALNIDIAQPKLTSLAHQTTSKTQRHYSQKHRYVNQNFAINKN